MENLIKMDDLGGTWGVPPILKNSHITCRSPETLSNLNVLQLERLLMAKRWDEVLILRIIGYIHVLKAAP